MSKLKDYSILDIEAIDDERYKTESAPGKWVQESRVYLKSEADRYIAHQKYKRCLAMAKWCYDRWIRAYHSNKLAETRFYVRWKKRWQELAEKFKEAK